jgi:hypothetical protein
MFADFRVFTAIHRFLVKDSVSLSLLGAWALSECFVFFYTMASITHLSGEDRNTVREYLVFHTMAIVPFVLLLSQVEGSIIGKLHETSATTGPKYAYFSPFPLVWPRIPMDSTFEGVPACSPGVWLGTV